MVLQPPKNLQEQIKKNALREPSVPLSFLKKETKEKERNYTDSQLSFLICEMNFVFFFFSLPIGQLPKTNEFLPFKAETHLHSNLLRVNLAILPILVVLLPCHFGSKYKTLKSAVLRKLWRVVTVDAWLEVEATWGVAGGSTVQK